MKHYGIQVKIYDYYAFYNGFDRGCYIATIKGNWPLDYYSSIIIMESSSQSIFSVQYYELLDKLEKPG